MEAGRTPAGAAYSLDIFPRQGRPQFRREADGMKKRIEALALQFMPSPTDLAFLLPLVFIFARLNGATTLLGDGDTGWHIRTGEWILAHGRIPDKDLFSFSKPGAPWFAWEWLWDVAFGWLHQHGGMAAVLLASLFLICLITALLYRLTLKKSGNVLIAFGVTAIATSGSTIHWLARPHLFTLLFVIVFYNLLERVQDGNRRLLLLLPVLMVLWTNLHGGWIAGILMVLCYAAGDLVSWMRESTPETRQAALSHAKQYLSCAAGCLLATFINPYFYQLHLHIFRFFREPFHLENITEFQSISFHHPAAIHLEIMLLLAVIAVVFWSVSRKRFAYAFLLIGWGHLALFSARNIPIFLIVAAPPVAAALQEILVQARIGKVSEWLRNHAISSEHPSELNRVGRFHLASALAFALVVVLVYAPAPPEKFRAGYDAKRYPVKAVSALEGAGFATQIFTDDDWGGYLIYRLYPASKVFVDGRSDFYGQSFEEKYFDLVNLKYDWERTLDRYRVETVLLPVNQPLASVLKESRRWQPVYDDGVAIVFRPSGANAYAEAKQLSANGSIGGVNRDCQIAKTSNRDRRITQHNP
jgi:hypothetical protein